MSFNNYILIFAILKVLKDNYRDLLVVFRELVINEILVIFKEYLWYIYKPRMSISSIDSI